MSPGALSTNATSPEGMLGFPIPTAIATTAKRTTKATPKINSPRRRAAMGAEALPPPSLPDAPLLPLSGLTKLGAYLFRLLASGPLRAGPRPSPEQRPDGPLAPRARAATPFSLATHTAPPRPAPSDRLLARNRARRRPR